VSDNFTASSFVLAQEIQKSEQNKHFHFSILVTFMMYIVDLTAAELLLLKMLPRYRCPEHSHVALSLDKRMLIAELQTREMQARKTSLIVLIDHDCFFHKSEVQLEAGWCFAASGAGSSTLKVG
jgi:hypothetical protein